MHLSRIELVGFKSFANRTVLDFAPGVTAVVGPNGSGKSNVSDAIRWVLGEQSMKNLRGKNREDVIFSGSAQKARMGLAEVSLTFDNQDGRAPIDLTEITLTRRLDRAGESTYFINRVRARLADIQELLAKAGFAQSTYSVIGQGMIDSVVTATPKERREIFEDAAGIRPYQLKRKQALSKLASTERNLEQVDAHLSELAPHVRSLRRQAQRAEKKEALLAERVTLREGVYNHLWNEVRARLSDTQTRVEGMAAEETRLATATVQAETTIDQLAQEAKKPSTQIEPLLQEREEAQRAHTRLSERLSVVRGRIQAETNRTSAVDTTDLARRIEDLTTQLAADGEDRVRAESEHAQRTTEGEAARTEMQKASEARVEAQKLHDASGEALNAVRGRIQLEANRTQTVNVEELQRHMEETEAESAQFAQEQAQAEQSAAQASAETAQALAAAETCSTSITRLQDAIARTSDIAAVLSWEDVRESLGITLAQERAILEEAARCSRPEDVPVVLSHLSRTHADLRALHERIREATKDSDPAAQATLIAFQHELSGRLTEHRALQETLRQAHVQAAVAGANAENFSRRAAAAETRLERLRAQLQAAQDASGKDVERQNLLATLAQEESVLLAKLAATEQALRAAETRLSDARAQSQQTAVDAARALSRLEALRAQIARTEAEHARLTARLKEALATTKHKKEADVLLRELRTEQEQLETAFATSAAHVTALDAQMEADRRQAQERQTVVFAQERALRELQKQLTDVREHLKQLAVEQARIEEHRDTIRQELSAALSEGFLAAVQGYERAPLTLLADAFTEQRERLTSVERQLLSIGEIPPDVLDDYRSSAERETFLTQQREDIVGAHSKLQIIIKELDATMQKQFDAAFTHINEQFAKSFKILFNGGRASVTKRTVVLKQTDEDGNVVSGETEGGVQDVDAEATVTEDLIEISATPPGKKLSSLSMLSGGEKALTSIALILAIIHHNPSPFIVLDEVDAALDEANAERFAKVLDDVSQDAQFIVITHARATMRRANALYGVTMEESGISKLLSVRLEEAATLAARDKEAVPA